MTKPVNQSKELTQFYADWYMWATSGAIEPHYAFRRWHGLCNSVWSWAHAYTNNGIERLRLCSDLDYELKTQFEQAGLDYAFPFGERNYNYRRAYENQHECPVRLKWVLDHIIE